MDLEDFIDSFLEDFELTDEVKALREQAFKEWALGEEDSEVVEHIKLWSEETDKLYALLKAKRTSL